MAVTLADVAARAGVSAATVSRVLSGNYPVSGPTRSRVLRAVDELEYVVNGQASALAAATSDLVGVIVSDIADPFFALIAAAVQQETGDRKLAVVCSTGDCPEREMTYLTLLQRQRADAVVLTGSAVEDEGQRAALASRLRRMSAGGTRIVLCGRPPLEGTAEEGIIALAFDNHGGAQRLTEHLVSLGHRRIGCVAGPPGRSTTRHRLAGHLAALEAAGAADGAGERTVHADTYERAAGYRGALELLRRDPELTALVAANDTLALGVCSAVRDQGLRIPEDISVTGFDDLPSSSDCCPALTTVLLPLRGAGARAGRLALGREKAPPDGVATLGAQLTVRGSTGPPRPFPRAGEKAYL